MLLVLINRDSALGLSLTNSKIAQIIITVLGTVGFTCVQHSSESKSNALSNYRICDAS